MPKTHNLIIIIITCLSFIFVSSSFANNKVRIADFSHNDLEGWENNSFSGETTYTLAQENQQHFLQADSKQAASALYKKVKINIKETPFLNWSWRIDQALSGLDEKTKIGDDYAARIYVVFKTGFTPLSAKALNYVWSSGNTINTHWPNPYTSKAIMIPIRCNLDKNGVWQHEKVNIVDDLQKHFKKVPNYIDGIAIMTDTDNSKKSATASYGDIYFTSN